jgi:hypothetical protein
MMHHLIPQAVAKLASFRSQMIHEERQRRNVYCFWFSVVLVVVLCVRCDLLYELKKIVNT